MPIQPRIRNVLVKSEVWATKQRCREILEIFPKATIFLTWMPGHLNTADYASKLHTDPVKILNVDDYKKGVNGMLTIDNKLHVCNYEVSKTKEKYTPLPDHLIEGANNRDQELIKLDPTRTLSRNKEEEKEKNMCSVCIDEEGCGVYIMTRSAKAREDKSSATDSDKISTHPCNRFHTLNQGHLPNHYFKATKEKANTSKEERILRENAHYKAVRKSVHRNLFEADRNTSCQHYHWIHKDYKSLQRRH